MTPSSIAISNIVTAFDTKAIGSRVVGAERSVFMQAVAKAIDEHDQSADGAPGQHFIRLPDEACELVWGGVGKRTTDPLDYVVRTHRGQVSLYLNRDMAAPVDSVHVVVYTLAAYLKDPDGDPIEHKRVIDTGCTHVLVAVLASAGPKPALGPYRFVHNLAGGNNEALAWTADEIRAKAKEILEYENTWITVAD